MSDLDFYRAIEKQLETSLPFVIYREPGQLTIKAILQKDNKLNLVKSFLETGFVFAPFDNQHKTVLIIPDNTIETVLAIKPEKILKTRKHSFDESDCKKHLQLVKKGITAIQNGSLKKVVLSRKEQLHNIAHNPIDIVKRLLTTYPNAFVYLWHHPKVGMWTGATPEVLLKTNDSTFETMALAGTKLYSKGKEAVWGKKEQEEQQIVTDTIVKNLEKKVITINLSDIHTYKAGSLLHLRTLIKGTLQNKKLKVLIETLHPTPAICGFPKEEAKRFIDKNEGYDRTYYTGFLGPLNMDKGIAAFYVNLRCMQIEGSKITLYIGGGITIESDPQSEWEETINKAQTMLSVL